MYIPRCSNYATYGSVVLDTSNRVYCILLLMDARYSVVQLVLGKVVTPFAKIIHNHHRLFVIEQTLDHPTIIPWSAATPRDLLNMLGTDHLLCIAAHSLFSNTESVMLILLLTRPTLITPLPRLPTHTMLLVTDQCFRIPTQQLFPAEPITPHPGDHHHHHCKLSSTFATLNPATSCVVEAGPPIVILEIDPSVPW